MKSNWRELTAKTTSSIRDVMQVIDRGSVELALIVDGLERLLGTVTDGDIRRALLRGAALDSPIEPVMNRNFQVLGPEVGRAEALDLMRARAIKHVPVLNNDGRLVSLHLLRELIGATERDNWAVIMAGGKGTRLHPLTANLPKPMLRIAGRSILERLILHLVGYGIRKIYLSIGHLGHMIENYFEDGSAFGCQVEYLREKEPLGTGGALSLLPESPTQPLLVLNGDLVTQANVDRMLEYHERNSYKVTVGVRDYTHSIPYGVLEAADGLVVGLREKPIEVWLINSGIYVIEPDIPMRVPKGYEYQIPSILEECLARGERVGMFHLKEEEEWIDVGQQEELQRARGESLA